MLLLGDRNLPIKALTGQVAATGADFPMRVNTTTARDLLILAAHQHEHTAIDHTAVDSVGRIGTAVLATLLPARRTRTSDRAIKCAASKYQARVTTDRTSRAHERTAWRTCAASG
ncbi:hypothetical protein ACIA03_07720 [Nocardioides sp. NPDC051685]|uniref:hypothetical protein n=1 Tax=Nocardioides sp. NPDC051685 TaxID=3364334 RepID=UPI0037941AEB